MTDAKFTVQAAVDGNLQLSDLRMDPATLAHQAVVAEDGGNPQLWRQREAVGRRNGLETILRRWVA